MRIDAVGVIREHLTMREVFEKYGYSINKKGFICCPFHREKTPSMMVYEKDYHCFGCGEHGDAISFVQKTFSLPFKESLKKLDLDFGLNIYGEHSFEEIRRSNYQQQALRAKREREKREREKAENDYWAAFDEWKRLDDNRMRYKPKSQDEKVHPLFVESLQKLEYQEYILNNLEQGRVLL